jgi:predicted metal-dependent HD superfamily phosphohydrolase
VATAGLDVRDALLARYSEPHRAYHTLQHLGECLALFDEVASLARHAAEIELALWFHDAIYDVPAVDNEARSADWAVSALRAAAAPATVAERVHALVMATRHAASPTPGTDEELLVDIDLSILGATPERFAEYETQIRREYAHVPEAEFWQRRKGILRAFLDRPAIYGTQPLHARFEAAARNNLRRAAA